MQTSERTKDNNNATRQHQNRTSQTIDNNEFLLVFQSWVDRRVSVGSSG